MKVYGGKRNGNRQSAPPDILEQARNNLGFGADPCIVTDNLFDAAFRSLKSVATDHPNRWPMLIRYYEKLARLYEEAFEGEGSAGENMIVPKRPDPGGLQMVSAPGMQYTTATSDKPKP